MIEKHATWKGLTIEVILTGVAYYSCDLVESPGKYQQGSLQKHTWNSGQLNTMHSTPEPYYRMEEHCRLRRLHTFPALSGIHATLQLSFWYHCYQIWQQIGSNYPGQDVRYVSYRMPVTSYILPTCPCSGAISDKLSGGLRVSGSQKAPAFWCFLSSAPAGAWSSALPGWRLPVHRFPSWCPWRISPEWFRCRPAIAECWHSWPPSPRICYSAAIRRTAAPTPPSALSPPVKHTRQDQLEHAPLVALESPLPSDSPISCLPVQVSVWVRPFP